VALSWVLSNKRRVVRCRWLDEPTYADRAALCQFLPGPASSQVGFSIGLMRAGYLGGLAAWAGFTLPSALLLVLFAYGATQWQGSPWVGILHGLKLVAYAPLWTSAVNTRGDFGVVLVGFVLLTAWRAPPFLIVILSALGGMVLV